MGSQNLKQIEYKEVKTQTLIREEWLNKAIDFFYSDLMSCFDKSKTRASVGFPKNSKTAIGQVWSSLCSKDETFEVFINPEIGNTVRALDILAHELTHINVGLDMGHNHVFAREVKRLGLEGRPTATYAGEAFKQSAEEFIKLEGEYPHAEMQISGYRKQTTRMIKIHCEECGLIARISKKYIEEGRIPFCLCNDQQLSVEY
ncbi:MAG: hypothetical protein HN576_06625 [Bacteriovoracaceae bacterium]|jgi:hypothetical protein|nr:hypothetical protein [Bacteriovoracaceae bacterium]